MTNYQVTLIWEDDTDFEPVNLKFKTGGSYDGFTSFYHSPGRVNEQAERLIELLYQIEHPAYGFVMENGFPSYVYYEELPPNEKVLGFVVSGHE